MPRLDKQRARALAVNVARERGLDTSDARIMRVANSVLVEFPRARVVGRVDERADRAWLQWRLARFWEERDAPTLRLHDATHEPHVCDEAVVTLWEHLVSCATTDHETLGRAVRAVHQCGRHDIPDELPRLDPFVHIDDSLAHLPPWLADADERGLVDRAEALRMRWHAIAEDPAQDRAVLHGDVHLNNVMVTERGVVLLDLEDGGVGPTSWELVPLELAVRRYGADPDDMRAFLAGYGAGPLDRPAFETMCEIYELLCGLWAVSCTDRMPSMRREAEIRVDTLLGRADRVWTQL